MTCGKTPVYFCICSEEWCWCSNRMPEPEQECEACADGQHVMQRPDSDRTNGKQVRL